MVQYSAIQSSPIHGLALNDNRMHHTVAYGLLDTPRDDHDDDRVRDDRVRDDRVRDDRVRDDRDDRDDRDWDRDDRDWDRDRDRDRVRCVGEHRFGYAQNASHIIWSPWNRTDLLLWLIVVLLIILCITSAVRCSKGK